MLSVPGLLAKAPVPGVAVITGQPHRDPIPSRFEFYSPVVRQIIFGVCVPLFCSRPSNNSQKALEEALNDTEHKTCCTRLKYF
jgi:hypothetical protein